MRVRTARHHCRDRPPGGQGEKGPSDQVKMAPLRLSQEAQEDIEAILAWTDEQFGEGIRVRYEELLAQAFLDLAEDQGRPGTLRRPELAKGAFTYHLRHSRDRVSRSKGRGISCCIEAAVATWKLAARCTTAWIWCGTSRPAVNPPNRMSDGGVYVSFSASGNPSAGMRS